MQGPSSGPGQPVRLKGNRNNRAPTISTTSLLLGCRWQHKATRKIAGWMPLAGHGATEMPKASLVRSALSIQSSLPP